MRMHLNIRSLPVILIALGIGFLLYNLRIIPFSPWTLFWPVIMILFGLSQLRDVIKRPRSPRQNSLELVIWLAVTGLGFYLLLPKIGIHVPSLPWKIVWPTLLIIWGFAKLFGAGSHRFNFKRKPAEQEGGNQGYQYSFVGETRRGPSNWVLEDLHVHQVIGSVNLDLTQAIIPEEEIHLEISGCVGEVVIYLPPGLPFKAECQLSLGEIAVLDRTESGSHKYIKMQSSNFAEATRKLNIKVHWRIGEVRIRQIQ